MKKRNILWPLAIVAVLGSPSASAVDLSFAFPVQLTQTSCFGLPVCGPQGQTDEGAIFVRANIADPFVNQNRISNDVEFLGPIRNWSAQSEIGRATRNVSYEANIGVGTIELPTYGRPNITANLLVLELKWR